MLEVESERKKPEEESGEQRKNKGEEQRICTIYMVIYLWEHCSVRTESDPRRRDTRQSQNMRRIDFFHSSHSLNYY